MVNIWDVAIHVEVLKREGEKRNRLAIQNHYYAFKPYVLICRRYDCAGCCLTGLV